MKIAADHFPTTKVVATGSSTLAARAKFRDTLAGRKTHVHLTPMALADVEPFGDGDLLRRLRHGGRPPCHLADEPPYEEMKEWIEAYRARDIQELDRRERRHAFFRLIELLFLRRGGVFEASALARPCEISRPAVQNHVAVLEDTHVVRVVRPFHGGAAREILVAPKVYGGDTGLIAFFNGWMALRSDDAGRPWEHLVRNELEILPR